MMEALAVGAICILLAAILHELHTQRKIMEEPCECPVEQSRYCPPDNIAARFPTIPSRRDLRP